VGEQSPARQKRVTMRSREEINKAPSFPEAKMVEILLDIRELLEKQKPKRKYTKKVKK